jgi:hypothetical protein
MNTALEKARETRKRNAELGIETQIKNHWEKWLEKDTRVTAIKAFCLHCMGGADNPGYRSMIAECSASRESSQPCPLYNWRPYKKKEDDLL